MWQQKEEALAIITTPAAEVPCQNYLYYTGFLKQNNTLINDAFQEYTDHISLIDSCSKRDVVFVKHMNIWNSVIVH